jgi:hypothetical protein
MSAVITVAVVMPLRDSGAYEIIFMNVCLPLYIFSSLLAKNLIVIEE